MGPVWADSKQLQRVFDNLVANALKFTPSGGCIMIRARWTPDRYLFEVVDSGRGIQGEAQTLGEIARKERARRQARSAPRGPITSCVGTSFSSTRGRVRHICVLTGF